MRRTVFAAILLLLALLMTAAALAETAPEGPVNPYRQELEAHARLEPTLLRAAKAAEWSHSIVLRRNHAGQALNFSYNETWYIDGVKDAAGNSCELSEFQYEFIFGEGSSPFAASWVIYYQKKSDSPVFDCCSIVYPGSYRLMVLVFDKDTGVQVYQGTYTYTVAADDDHPPLGTTVAQIVAENRGATDWETALNLYDWVMAHTVYDNTLRYHGADGTLLRGIGVCDSYAKAYYLLLQEAGIDAVFISSNNHAWNAICLDGQWYQTDATWDDTAGALHEFFCVTDALMIDSGHNYTPSAERNCDSLAMNYYVQRGGWSGWDIAFLDSLYDAVLDGRGGVGVRPSDETFRHLTILAYILSNQAQWYEDLIADRTLTFRFSANVFSCAVADGHVISGDWVYTPLPGDCAAVAGYLGIATSLTVPGTLDGCAVTGIDACAFRNNAALVTLNVPAGLLTVGAGALDGCTGLAGLTLPAGLTAVGADALPAGTVLTCGQETALARALGEAGYAFRDTAYPGWLLRWMPGEPMTLAAMEVVTDAETLTLPDCVNALMGLTADNLRMLYAGPQVTLIGADVTAPASLLAVVTVSGSAAADWGAAQHVRVLATDRQTTLPAMLTEIEDEAYAGTALTWVIIPDSVSVIGAEAFAGCGSLAAVTMPAGAVQIDTSAFQGCSVLLLVTKGSPAEAWALDNGIPVFAQ